MTKDYRLIIYFSVNWWTDQLSLMLRHRVVPLPLMSQLKKDVKACTIKEVFFFISWRQKYSKHADTTNSFNVCFPLCLSSATDFVPLSWFIITMSSNHLFVRVFASLMLLLTHQSVWQRTRSTQTKWNLPLKHGNTKATDTNACTHTHSHTLDRLTEPRQMN